MVWGTGRMKTKFLSPLEDNEDEGKTRKIHALCHIPYSLKMQHLFPFLNQFVYTLSLDHLRHLRAKNRTQTVND